MSQSRASSTVCWQRCRSGSHCNSIPTAFLSASHHGTSVIQTYGVFGTSVTVTLTLTLAHACQVGHAARSVSVGRHSTGAVEVVDEAAQGRPASWQCFRYGAERGVLVEGQSVSTTAVDGSISLTGNRASRRTDYAAITTVVEGTSALLSSASATDHDKRDYAKRT